MIFPWDQCESSVMRRAMIIQDHLSVRDIGRSRVALKEKEHIYRRSDFDHKLVGIEG